MIQVIKSGITRRVFKIGEPISLRRKHIPVTGANYNYVNSNASIAPIGTVVHVPASLWLRINEVDADGINRSWALGQIQAGYTITIGSQSAIAQGIALQNTGSWSVPVDAWPVLPDGPYVVTVTAP